MQQKVCTRNTTVFVKNGQACLQFPFSCPGCGEHERFHSHLDYTHPLHIKREDCVPRSCDAGTSTNSKGTHQHQTIITTDVPQEHLEHKTQFPKRSFSVGDTTGSVAPVLSVEKRLEGMMKTANSSMERRLLRLSCELAQTDTAILCERAHSHHLAQEKQEVLEREQALSRQVDAAVMVIATLRQQLSISEHELERREQEVLTIQKFLEAAAQHEMCGKVRLRRFIESLLRRISLAERLLEYYQSGPCGHYCSLHHVPEHRAQRINHSSLFFSDRSFKERLELDEEQHLLGQSGSGASKRSVGRQGHSIWSQRRRSDGYEV